MENPMRSFLSPYPLSGLAGAIGLVLSGQSTPAQTVEQFYAGRQVTLIIGNAVGSGYDAIGRMVARHMGKYLPGDPKFVVQNMNGAGGIIAANYMNTIAAKDGSVIAVTNREAIFDPLFSGESSKANYDSRKFLWIGTPNQEIGMAYATTASGLKTIEDAMKREVVVAAAGVTSGSAVFPRLVNALIGTKFKIVPGYPGSMEAMLAMERGEADARVTSGWAGPETTQGMQWVKEGKATLLLQIGINKDSRYADVPNIMDYAKSDEQRSLMRLLFIGQTMGRPFFGPPGVPTDRANALREAFVKTMNDSEFKKEADDQKIDLSPLSGAEMQAIVEQLYDTPKPLLQKAVDISASAQK
jgi:tripartite-type tricarboxylate transporter receptor subunit TctC